MVLAPPSSGSYSFSSFLLPPPLRRHLSPRPPPHIRRGYFHASSCAHIVPPSAPYCTRLSPRTPAVLFSTLTCLLLKWALGNSTVLYAVLPYCSTTVLLYYCTTILPYYRTKLLLLYHYCTIPLYLISCIFQFHLNRTFNIPRPIHSCPLLSNPVQSHASSSQYSR